MNKIARNVLALIVFAICSYVNAGIEIEVVELGGSGQSDICNDFFLESEENEVKKFFMLAEISDVTFPTDSDCYLDGVIQDNTASKYSFAITDSGIGFIGQKVYQCVSGSKCCDELPHFCRKSQ